MDGLSIVVLEFWSIPRIMRKGGQVDCSACVKPVVDMVILLHPASSETLLPLPP